MLTVPQEKIRRLGRTIARNDPRLTAEIPQKVWERLLGLIATGHHVQESIEALELDPVVLEGVLRGDPLKYRAWREANITADRRDWSVETLEGIAECIALNPEMGLREVCARFEKTPDQYLRLARRDPAIKEMYEEARAIAAEIASDRLLEIADCDIQDETSEGKPNMAAVNRAKLRIETRLTLMGANNRKYATSKQAAGDTKVNVQVNVNHADRLESARARVRRAQTQEDAQVIEGNAVTVTNGTPDSDAEDMSWAD